MYSNNVAVLLPIIVAAIFGLAGLAGAWWLTRGFLVSGYVALVISAQHNVFLGGMVAEWFDLGEAGSSGASALAFGASLVVTFLVVLVIFAVLWRPQPYSQGGLFQWSACSGCWGRLAAGGLSALLGWLLGAVLAVCVAVLATGWGLDLGVDWGIGAYTDTVYRTAQIAVGSTNPWVPGSTPPVFLRPATFLRAISRIVYP